MRLAPSHPPLLDPNHVHCRYAWECQTAEGGWGLDGVLREGAWKLRGIVNGIDTQEWSPERDSFLRSDGYENYSAANLREGKARCKAALQRVRATRRARDHSTAHLRESLSMFSACMLLQRALQRVRATGQQAFLAVVPMQICLLHGHPAGVALER